MPELTLSESLKNLEDYIVSRLEASKDMSENVAPEFKAACVKHFSDLYDKYRQDPVMLLRSINAGTYR